MIVRFASDDASARSNLGPPASSGLGPFAGGRDDPVFNGCPGVE
jgi:hypothetical protein